MEYYAKSKARELTEREKDKLADAYQTFLHDMDDNLEQWEREILTEAKSKIFSYRHADAVGLKEHLDQCERCSRRFFEQYGSYFTEKEIKLIQFACRIHDLGKANYVFQSKLRPDLFNEMQPDIRNIVQIPHGYLSALSISKKDILEVCPEITEEDFQSVVTAVYYHHARGDVYDDREIKKYSDLYYKECITDYLGRPEWKLQVSNRNQLLFVNSLSAVNRRVKQRQWNEYVTIKGMLNKFDWSVSAGYAVAEDHTDIVEKKLRCHIEQNIGDSLRPAQKFMLEHQNENLIVVAPTGSGKTEAALLWINGEKGFYTLPLKVSSNAIYERIRKKYAFESVSLLHSDSMQQYMKEFSGWDQEDGYEKFERAKLLSSPLTVCTVDQLFKFVYLAIGTEIFAATLKYSKIVLDEMQSYSPRVAATVIYGLKMLHSLGGRFAIITATFPPVLKYFMEQYGLLEGTQYIFRDFSIEADSNRHKLVIRESEFDIQEIAEQGLEKKVLVICNTVTKAQDVYEQILGETEEVYLLHSRLLRKDRAVLESSIMEFSKSKSGAGIWVTTQIVEASLDIDFDILFTEMCTCDSLLQRMGRCNRAGRYFPEDANIVIFATGNGVGKNVIYEEELYHRSLMLLQKYEGLVFTERMKTEYMDEVYNPEEIKETSYYTEIEQYLKHFAHIKPLDYKKEEADEQFRMIRSITVIPESIYKEQRGLFEQCLEFMNKPFIGRAAKEVLKSKLDELTLSINLYWKFPEGVDKQPIPGTQIHRARLSYDFDSNKKQGKGLVLCKMEDETCFL